MKTPALSIRKLDSACLPKFLQFFDGDAFSDNPKWSSCYCQCFYEDHDVVKWSDRTAAQNRALACSRTASGDMQGYLAIENDHPVGWCGAAPRRLLHALDDEPTPDAQTVGAIVCFLVAPRHRGRGIARSLLDAACIGLREQGMTIAEANPRPNARTPADHHFGPLSLYLSSGFCIHREDDDGSVYVRRAL
jgi:GNAT superfamily N-acetyltransferase